MYLKKNCLIVSCQAEEGDPFDTPEGILLLAKAAVMGGANGIRSEGFSKTKKIIESVDVPVIGLIKSTFEDGTVRITGSIEDIKKLLIIGCNIFAIDGTNRLRESLTGPAFIHNIKCKYECKVIADISNLNEAKLCIEAGADLISTTLNGYTPWTIKDNNRMPNFRLVEELVDAIKVPVLAEGRIYTPEQAKKMIEIGAYGIVIGTIITRPRVITSFFYQKINS